METRKRGGTRDSTDEYDTEIGSKGLEQVTTTPYSVMDPVHSPTSHPPPDGILKHATGEESHLRSLAKGLTWRFVASGTTIIIAKIVTGETTVAFQIGFFEFFAKIGIYYVHERIWAKIKI